MRKRLWDLAKSRIEIGTILPGHRHKVARFRLKFASPLAASRRRSMTKRKTELRPNCETIAIGVGLKDLPRC